MNDEFRKALDTRLSGLQWGEREQAQVLRAIQQKEEPEVKHIQRGTMLLAFAIATLIIVMGAALATSSTLPSIDSSESTPLNAPLDFEPVLEKPVLYESERLIVYEESAYYDGVNGEVILRVSPADRSKFTVACQWNEVKFPGRTTLVVKPQAEVCGLHNHLYTDTNYTFDSARTYSASGYDLLCTFRLTKNVAAEPVIRLRIDLEIDDESTGAESVETFYYHLKNPFRQTYYHLEAKPTDTDEHPHFVAGSLIDTGRYRYATLMFRLPEDIGSIGYPSTALHDESGRVISGPTPMSPHGSTHHIIAELDKYAPDCLMVQEACEDDCYITTLQLPADGPLPDRLLWRLSAYSSAGEPVQLVSFATDVLTDAPLTILKKERSATLFLEEQHFDGENLTMTLLTSVCSSVELTDFHGYLSEQSEPSTNYSFEQLSDVSSRVTLTGSVTPAEDPAAPLEMNLSFRYKDTYGNNFPLEVSMTIPVGSAE